MIKTNSSEYQSVLLPVEMLVYVVDAFEDLLSLYTATGTVTLVLILLLYPTLQVWFPRFLLWTRTVHRRQVFAHLKLACQRRFDLLLQLCAVYELDVHRTVQGSRGSTLWDWTAEFLEHTDSFFIVGNLGWSYLIALDFLEVSQYFVLQFCGAWVVMVSADEL